ncbi:hypothetical protein ACLOAV_003136 [Pseudogymnoascus australis]
MRLLNVDTLKLEEFLDHRTIRYAIFSHTWDEKEVSFADMQRGLRHATALPYFKKIRGACRQAASDGFKFVWVDTCCIDNSSSAELSEALNSMFHWYSDAGVCYAYLSDVVEVGDGPVAESQFRNSRWFTRGWTLQELLAPKKVVFYSREWAKVGSKGQFATRISEITRIHPKALEDFDITEFSIAERMSWASDRVTTRQEDVAYCLLGLFGVNMALLYGEGERAFIRLEEEIIKSSDDHSIFAWISPHIAPYMGAGLLATSPSQFKHSRGITPFQADAGISRPYLMTNKGLSINMNLVRGYSQHEYFALLDCRTGGGLCFAICLRELIHGGEGLQADFSHGRNSSLATSTGDQFIRVRCPELYAMQSRNYDRTAELFVRQTTYLPRQLFVRQTTDLPRQLVHSRGREAFRLIQSSPSFTLLRVLDLAPEYARPYPGSRNGELVCICGHDYGILVDIPMLRDGWVATAIFGSTWFGPEVWIMLGWTRIFGVSVHICGGYNKNSNGDIVGAELRPLNSITKTEIIDPVWNQEGPIPVSVKVDMQHGRDIATPHTSNPTTKVPTQRRNATDRQPTTTDTMDTQRPPKKPARVYGKKKQVSKSAGIFLQDSSPAPQKVGELEVEDAAAVVEEKREEEGNGKGMGSEDAIGDKKLATESREGGSPTQSRSSSSSATPVPETTKTTNAKPKTSKSSRAKKKMREQKEKDNGESQPAADGHNTPKPATKPKAFSDPEALVDLTHTLNALQLTSTSPPASQSTSQPPPPKHRTRRPRAAAPTPASPALHPPPTPPTSTAPSWLAPLPAPLPWSHLLHPTWPLTKLTESSYAEIYTLHNPSGSSILKILALRPPRGPGSRRETACKVEDVLSEVAILDLVTDVSGFVVFRGVFVARGGVPRGVVKAWEGWDEKEPGEGASVEESEAWEDGRGRSVFPYPGRYHKDQLFLVLELGDAGKDLEHYKLTTREELWDVFLGTAMALATGEDMFGFEHRDLHEGNICLRRAGPASKIPAATSSTAELRSGFSGLEITLLDYTLSRARTEEGKTLFLDLDDPENAALFEDCEPGTKEQERKQRRVYSAMREHVVAQEKLAGGKQQKGQVGEGRWAQHHPYTNVLWLSYILEYTITHFAGPKAALKLFEEEIADVRATLRKGKREGDGGVLRRLGRNFG